MCVRLPPLAEPPEEFPDFMAPVTRRALMGRSLAVGAGLALGGAVAGGWAGPAPAQRSPALRDFARFPPTPRLDPRGTQLIVLGAGGGPDAFTRSGVASAVWCRGAVYLVDFGMGTHRQFRLAGLKPGQVRATFLTHLHSDHTIELYSFFSTLYYYLRKGQRISMFGPASAATHAPAGDAVPGLPTVPDAVTINPARPTPGFVDTLRAFAEGPFAYDNNVRIRDEGMPDLLGLGGGPPVLDPREIAVPADGTWQRNAPDMAPVEVFEDEHVKVTAILVDHPPVFPAYAFRFDTPDGSIVFSGDTTASPNLIKLARGADVLIHEVIHFGYLEWLGQSLVQQGGSPERLIRHLTAAHTSDRSVAKTGTRPAITGVGTVARRAGVRRLVLNHLVPTADLSRDGRWFDIPAREWHRHPAREFDGPVTVGSDLLTVRLRRASRHRRRSVTTTASSAA